MEKWIAFMIAAVTIEIIIVVARYRADRNTICGKKKIDRNKALILRLQELEKRYVLTKEEFQWKKEELEDKG